MCFLCKPPHLLPSPPCPKHFRTFEGRSWYATLTINHLSHLTLAWRAAKPYGWAFPWSLFLGSTGRELTLESKYTFSRPRSYHLWVVLAISVLVKSGQTFFFRMLCSSLAIGTPNSRSQNIKLHVPLPSVCLQQNWPVFKWVGDSSLEHHYFILPPNWNRIERSPLRYFWLSLPGTDHWLCGAQYGHMSWSETRKQSQSGYFTQKNLT